MSTQLPADRQKVFDAYIAFTGWNDDSQRLILERYHALVAGGTADSYEAWKAHLDEQSEDERRVSRGELRERFFDRLEEMDNEGLARLANEEFDDMHVRYDGDDTFYDVIQDPNA